MIKFKTSSKEAEIHYNQGKIITNIEEDYDRRIYYWKDPDISKSMNYYCQMKNHKPDFEKFLEWGII